MTRHQRRKLALKRKLAKTRAVTNRLNSQMVHDKIKANLSSPYRGKRSPKGVVSSIYSGTANALGYTRTMRYSKGVAK